MTWRALERVAIDSSGVISLMQRHINGWRKEVK
jgi:hypothetical protein